MILAISELTTVPIPNNNNVKKLEAAILQAEQVNIRPLLGAALFYDLEQNKANSKYQDLLNGKSYTYCDNTISFKGLNAVISNYAYAVYVSKANLIDTNSGLVLKKTEYSDHLEYSKLKAEASQYENLAISYWEDVKQFLCEFPDTYDLFKDNNVTPKSRMKITSIGRESRF